MLRVVGQANAHLEAAQTNGATYAVEWVDIADPNPTFPYTPGQTAPTTNNAALTYVGDQGRAHGAAHFSRLEGATFVKGTICFTSTQGGGPAEAGPQLTLGYGRGVGQVWSYDPRSQRLTCRFQSPGTATLEPPGQHHRARTTVAPSCSARMVRRTTTSVVSPANVTLFDIALNRLTGNSAPFATRDGEEFAGATFSPDGETLYVNIQASRGVTFAIWGPWGRLGV